MSLLNVCENKGFLPTSEIAWLHMFSTIKVESHWWAMDTLKRNSVMCVCFDMAIYWKEEDNMLLVLCSATLVGVK